MLLFALFKNLRKFALLCIYIGDSGEGEEEHVCWVWWDHREEWGLLLGYGKVDTEGTLRDLTGEMDEIYIRKWVFHGLGNDVASSRFCDSFICASTHHPSFLFPLLTGNLYSHS